MDAETISMIESLGLGKADYSMPNSSVKNKDRLSLEKKIKKLQTENDTLKTRLKSLLIENRRLRQK